MANLKKKVTRTGPPAPGNTIPEGTITEVVTDEKILDPNDPRAVSTPAEGLGGGNPLAGSVAQSPNEVDGSGPSPQVNPHTGEVVVGKDASPSEVSPTPSNVEAAESVDDVNTADDVAEQEQSLAEAVEEVVADAPTDNVPEPVAPEPPADEGDTENPPTNPAAVEPTPDPEPEPSE